MVLKHGTESFFSLVRLVNFQNVEKLGIINVAVYEAVYLKVCCVWNNFLKVIGHLKYCIAFFCFFFFFWYFLSFGNSFAFKIRTTCCTLKLIFLLIRLVYHVGFFLFSNLFLQNERIEESKYFPYFLQLSQDMTTDCLLI